MELKPGYKQTDVGVIPQDWDVCRLSSLIAAGPTNGYSGKSGAAARGTPTLTLGATTSGRLVLNSATVKRLVESLDHDSDVFLKAGDVLVQRSNTLDLVGTTAVYDGPDGAYAYPDLMMRLRFLDSHTAAWFWRYANGSDGRRYFRSVAAGSAGSMPKLNGEKLRSMLLPVPSGSEQRAIATALSEVDALLGALDRLIAKKRDLKQAAMQQLLTGQTRLPGFSGEWRSKSFSELLRYERPDRYLVNSTDYQETGRTPVLTANKSFVLGYTDEVDGVCNDLPAVIFDDFTTDAKYVDFPFKVKSSAIKILRPKDSSVSLKFIFERMRALEFPLGEHKRYYISEYQHVEVPMPESDEQAGIASVLSDMDAEIEALDARRAKTRDIKQAMMQELLTGRTRLV